MDIFNLEAFGRVGANNVFVKLNALLDWSQIQPLLKPTRHKLGQYGYDPVKLFKALLLGQWHSLSDRELEQALSVRLDFMLFCEFSAHDPVPDHSTLCRFRNQLGRLNLYDCLMRELERQLEAQNLKIERASHAIIDASIIESAARPKKQIEIIAEDRLEDEFPPEAPIIVTSSSVDGDAKWLKKGRKSYYGFKAFTRVDEEGYIEHCMLRPANEAEQPHFEAMLEGVHAKRILSDKGNASRHNRQILAARKLKDGIMHKAVRGKLLSKWEKRFNKMISKHRYVVEQSFGTLKRKFNYTRSSYMGLDKTQDQFIMKSICLNLLKAVNKITLFPKEKSLVTG